MPAFFNDLEGGTLPQFTLIQPRMATSATGPSNWQHPDNSVEAGEQLIAEIYTALRGSSYWNESLFIITYDEHGEGTCNYQVFFKWHGESRFVNMHHDLDKSCSFKIVPFTMSHDRFFLCYPLRSQCYAQAASSTTSPRPPRASLRLMTSSATTASSTTAWACASPRVLYLLTVSALTDAIMRALRDLSNEYLATA